jgi:isoleucyl-tRNA synthetase
VTHARRFVPGWDTHGLPIELKVLQSLPADQRAALDTLGLRAAARRFALETIEAQKQQFRRCVAAAAAAAVHV